MDWFLYDNGLRPERVKLANYIKRRIVYSRETRGGSRAAATSKTERFVMIVNDWKPLTIITKRSILDVAAVLIRLWDLNINLYQNGSTLGE